MKITDIFKAHSRTYSFEFFPPKDEISAVDFGINVGQLLKLNPSFVSVTYGAGGSTQERTFALVDYIQNRIGLNTMAHYTCVNASRVKVEADITYLKNLGIDNLMLLRGDPPKGEGKFVAHPEGFGYASELISFVKNKFDICAGGATYVEKHPEAQNLNDDIQNLKKKVDAGADFLLTQLFFDNSKYFEFIRTTENAGIHCRIIPGIIPITAYNQIKRFTQMSGANIPEAIIDKMNSYQNNPDKIYQIGMDFAIQQCRDLLIMGAPGLHFYTLNKSRATIEIFETLLR
jgi:methylenetetrahydrofolate reductase (NADPH)